MNRIRSTAVLVLLAFLLVACGSEEVAPTTTPMPAQATTAPEQPATSEPTAAPTEPPDPTDAPAVELTAEPTAAPPTAEPTSTPIPTPQISLDPGLYVYSNANHMRDITLHDGKVWTAGVGGVVAWDLAGGSHRKYTTLDGLPHIAANGIAVCPIPEPALVVATNEGLAIYDPAADRFTDGSVIYSAAGRVLEMACDATRLVAYDDDGVNVYDATTGQVTFTDDDLLAWVAVESITLAGDDIWLPSGYKGITRIRGEEVTIYSVENGNSPSDDVDAVAISPTGELWLGAGEGLFRLNANGESTIYDRNNTQGFPYFGPRSLTFAADGTLWLGFNGEICQFDVVAGGCLVSHKNQPGMAPGSISRVIVDDNGFIYYPSFNDGMSVFNGSTWTQYEVVNEFPRNFVYAFAQDTDNNIWVLGEGLHRTNLDASEWVAYKSVGGNDIATDPAGGVWTAGGRSLWHVNGDAIRQWGVADGLLDASANAVALDVQGRVWIGQEGGISIFDGESFTTYNVAAGWPEGNVRDLLADGDTMWAATTKGLVKIDTTHDSWEVVVNDTNIAPASQPNFGRIAFNTDGTLLLENPAGLFIYNGSNLARYQNVDCSLGATTVAPDGMLLFGCFPPFFSSAGEFAQGRYGLHYYDGTEWGFIGLAEGLPSTSVRAILLDTAGTWWIGGGDTANGGGILRVVP